MDVLPVNGPLGHPIGKHVACVNPGKGEHDFMIEKFTQILKVAQNATISQALMKTAVTAA